MHCVKLNFRQLVSLGAYALGCASLSATPPTDLLLGHFEPHIDYALSPGDPDSGWQFSVSYDLTGDFTNPSGVVRLDPANTLIVATPETEQVLTSAFQGLGAAGDSLWILPQNNQPGQIFLGWRTIISAGIFQRSINGFFSPDGQGNIIVELIDVSGPAVDAGGRFAMWESKSLGGVEMHFNSADGLDGNDRLEPVPIGSHTHYNWGLSQAGNYTATFRVSGRLNPWQPDGNTITSGSFDVHFAVPFSSVARGNAELRLGLLDAPSPAAIKPLSETVEYATGQVALVTEATEIEGIPRPYAFTLKPVGNTTAAAPHRVGVPGLLPVSLPDDTVLAASPLEILAVNGPGNLQVLAGAGADQSFVFSAPGIYRVELRTAALTGGTPVNGAPFELVFLAGLEADYDFAAWADSYERTHGLASGSLQPDGGDWDGDGVADLIEYQLFWEGFDPAIADGGKLPRPQPEDPAGLITFYRDTYKDTLNRNDRNIILEYSADLVTWLGWSDRNSGWPMEQYETSAELGNARARIQRRTLRLPTPTPERAFFRWRIDAAQ
jgi:surface-anchored protein